MSKGEEKLLAIFLIYLIFMLFLSESDTKVTLKNYEATFEGLIQSWIDRFPSSKIPNELIELWENDKKYFETK